MLGLELPLPLVRFEDLIGSISINGSSDSLLIDTGR